MRTIISLILTMCIITISHAQVTLKNDLSQRRHQIICSAYSPDGNYIATGGLDNKVFLWNNRTGSIEKELTGIRRFPLSIQFSPDGRHVVSAGKDSRVSIWEVQSGRLLNQLRGHRGDVSSVAISPDNRYIASAGHDRTIRIWELSTGNHERTLSGHRGEVMAVDYSPDGSRLISGSADGSVRIWDTRTGEQINTIQAHDGWVRTVAYSPTGNFFATGGHDNAIKIWNTRTMELHNSILAHSGWVETLSFSPDGRYLVSGSHDNYLVMIEARTGRIVFNSEKQDHYVLSVAFSPTGKEFISSSFSSNRLMVWNTSALNIAARQTQIAETRIPVRQKPRPSIQWNSQNNTETPTLSFRASFSINSEYPAEDIVVYHDGDHYISLGEVSYIPSAPFEQVIFLNEGINKIRVELLYENGVITSDELVVTFRPEEPEPEQVVAIEEEVFAQSREEISVKPAVETPIERIPEPAPAPEPAASQTIAATPSEITREPVIAAESVIPQPALSPLFNIPFQNPPNPYRFALIIGNEDYSSYQVGLHRESNVDFAVNDAKAFREYAIRVMGVPRDNILFLKNARAIEMDNEIQKLKNIIKALDGKADVIVYFAGHGFPDERTREPYIMPVDVSGTNLRFAIKINDFYHELTEYPSQRVTVFMDACFSGGARNVGLVSARGVRVRPQEHLLKGNLVVFSASSGNQSAHPYRDKGHGIFTYFLLNKLKETRGDISYRELSEYIRETVGVRSAIINNTEQTPQTNVSVDIEGAWHEWTIK